MVKLKELSNEDDVLHSKENNPWTEEYKQWSTHKQWSTVPEGFGSRANL